uniref:Uncharacterized protein n=1 Tax=Daphnia galeata TaxID=27404 RepID=A0A8J2RGF6_9CRUS|nr:unnamed protein product [Daphnia galeata]
MSERFQMSQNERTEVKRMSTFVAICHREAFLKSRLSSTAPALAIHYLLLMKLYDKEDNFIAQAAVKSILNPLFEKSPIPVGKPKFPTDMKNQSNVSDVLLSCIGPRSWLLFFLLKKDEELIDRIKAPVECWQHMVGYHKIDNFIMSLEVVNDCAERGVKLMTKFKNVSNNEEQQQYIMQFKGRAVDQMENAEIENIDKDYVLYLNDESFLSLNSANSLTLEKESFVNSEDSLPISDSMNVWYTEKAVA